MIDPRLTTQFTSETHSPQKLFRKGKDQNTDLSCDGLRRLLGSRFISVCLRSCGALPRRKSGEGAPRTAPLFGSLFLAEFVRELS